MSYNPERALWREVLLRQIEDALHGPAGITGTADRIRAIKDARRLLSKPSKQLDHLCTLADIDPSAVVARIGKQIADAPTPEQLAAEKKANRVTLLRRATQPKAKRVKVKDRLFTFKGESLTMQQWSDRTGLPVTTIASRLRDHWTIERALTQPIGQRNRAWGYTGVPNVADHTPCAAGVANSDGRPGVGSDFAQDKGTGGGRSAQDRPEISFSPPEKVKA